jgi:hypothetical protein
VSVTVCWAVKGGSGTTVVAATLALSCPAHSLLVDLDGELPAVLGLPEPSGQGIADWLGSDAPPGALDDLAVFVDRTTRLIPRGSTVVDLNASRWGELSEWLAEHPPAFVDAGTHPPPLDLLDGDVRSLLVTRACYLALRRAVAAPCRPDGVVLVHEPGRALRAHDVAHAVGAPVLASVSVDPAVARAVDAGLLATRLPRLLTRELRGAARAVERPALGVGHVDVQGMTA